MSCCNNNCNHDPCGSSFNQSVTKAGQYAQYAQTQANKAENLWLEFNALYLGSFAVAPTQDNQGNPLQVGALYWNTGANELYAWNGLTWVTATGFNELTPFLSTGSNTPRNLATRMADVVNVKDFGAVGDGVTDDTVAMLAAEATGKPVFFPSGNYNVTIVPKLGVSWGAGKVFISGIQTYLHPTTGPVNEIFVSVFGPNNTATANAYVELQRAIDFAQSFDIPLTLEPNAKYTVATGLTFKHGKSLTDTKRYNVNLNGNNSTFFSLSVINIMSIVPRCLIADAATGNGIAQINIRDINFSGFGNPTSKGLVIGAVGYICDNFNVSELNNVFFQSFDSDRTMQIIESRHISFYRVVIRGSTLRIESQAAGSFSGDLYFRACEFVASATKNNLTVNAGGPLNTNAQVRGVHFNTCIFYGSETNITSTGVASQVGDFWFNGCQWDQGTGRAIRVSALNSGLVFGFHFMNPYIAGYLNGGFLFDSNASAKLYLIFISNAQIGIISGLNPITFTGSGQNYSIQINNCSFGNCSGTNIISLNNCTDVQINDNISFLTASVLYGISVGGTLMNNYSIIGNLMNVATSAINDYTTGSPTKQVVNNLKT